MSIQTKLAKGIAAMGREEQGRQVEIDRSLFYGAEQVEPIPVIAGRVRLSATQISPIWELDAVEQKENVGKK